MTKVRLNSFIICILFSFLPVFAIGWDAPRYAPLPPALDGSMMPYDFKDCTQTTFLPDSLEPITAIYVARHGARYLSGPKKTDAVMKQLIKARNEGRLSDTGEAFLSLMEHIIATNTHNWGDLSQVGIAEEKLLGEHMFRLLPPLHKPGARIAAISSHVPRVVMTMYQFCHSLVRANDRVTTATDEGTQFNPLVCCFITDTAYAKYREKGNWRKVYDNFVASHVSAAPARRLFSSTSLSDSKLRKLTVDMYEVLKGNRAYGLPAPTTQWMSDNEFHACWQADNLRHYLRNSITPLSDLAAHATSPLLKQMINDADSNLANFNDGRPYNAINGYFGHCETLLPLLSLIGIPNMPAHIDLTNLDRYWKIQDLTPLAANLTIILAKAPSGQIYAAMQLNGHTIRPMRGNPEILPWPTLKAHWQSKLR